MGGFLGLEFAAGLAGDFLDDVLVVELALTELELTHLGGMF